MLLCWKSWPAEKLVCMWTKYPAYFKWDMICFCCVRSLPIILLCFPMFQDMTKQVTNPSPTMHSVHCQWVCVPFVSFGNHSLNRWGNQAHAASKLALNYSPLRWMLWSRLMLVVSTVVVANKKVVGMTAFYTNMISQLIFFTYCGTLSIALCTDRAEVSALEVCIMIMESSVHMCAYLMHTTWDLY